MTTNEAPPITQLEFKKNDFPKAERIAARLGYTQTAYTSSSALWGLFCLPDNPANRPSHHSDARTQYPPYVGGCIIKTTQFGLMFVQNLEDMHMEDLA